MHEKYDGKLEQLKADLQRSSKEKYEKERQLSAMGFFKLSEKKALRAEIERISEEVHRLEDEQSDWSAKKEAELREVDATITERCRILAYAWMEKYAPKEWKPALRCFYSLFSNTPMDEKTAYVKCVEALGFSSSYSYEIGRTLPTFSNPFVSKENGCFYFGIEPNDGKEDDEPLSEKKRKYHEYIDKAAAELYGEHDYMPPAAE